MKKIYYTIILIFSFLFLTSCINNVTVKFDTNCEIKLNDVVLKYGQVLDKPADLEQDDKVFIGWYLNNQPFDFSKGVTENITLTAYWVIAPEKELKEAEEILGIYKDTVGYQKSVERLARVLYKYDIDFEYLSELYLDKDSFITNIIEEDKLANTIAFSLYYIDIVLELENQNLMNNTLSLTEELNIQNQCHIYIKL